MKRDRVFARKCLTDTGFACRELFGFNYDEDSAGKKIHVGSGGIRDSGKTKECIELYDNDAVKHKYFKLPRGSRKSTMAEGFVARSILRNPDVRVIWVSGTDDQMIGKSLAIRSLLEQDDVTDLFGAQKGDKWEESFWSVRGRQTIGHDPTFRAFSRESMPTGGRGHIIVADDFIDDKAVANTDQDRKSKSKWAVLMPFLAPGGILIVNCTTWADDDLNGQLEAGPLFRPPMGAQIICGAGTRVIKRDDGTLDIEVTEEGLTFPHLTEEHLRIKFFAMLQEGKPDHYLRQYENESGSGDASSFQRHHFQPLAYGSDMWKLSGFLVTDTATSEDPDACYSAIAYIGLDECENIYLLDARVGQWDETEFTNQFFDVLEEWQDRVNHRGECWEKVALSTSFRGHIEKDRRARKLKLKTIEMQRSGTTLSKPKRINRFLPYMQKKAFFVVDTVPRTFTDAEGEKVLWDPIGHWDGRDEKYKPSGYLVDGFMKKNAKKDLPDAMAMLLEWSKVGRGKYKKLCTYREAPPKRVAVSLTDQRKASYHAANYPAAVASKRDDRDWWDKTFDGF